LATSAQWRELQRIARRQRGLFTIRQALDTGFTRWAVRCRLERDEWEEVVPRVLRAATGARLDWVTRLEAEQLATGALATGWSALAMFDLAVPPSTPELLVCRSKRNLERVRLHSTLILPLSDIVRVDGISCTAIPRSITMAANTMTDRNAQLLVTKVIARQRAPRDAIARRAASLSHLSTPGPRRVLRALAHIDPAIDRARNEWEALLVEACNEFGIPTPILNYPVKLDGRTRYLDAAWPQPFVFSEYDGFLEHLLSRERFEDDRVRQNDAVAAGWLPFRFTAGQLRPPLRAKEFGKLARAVVGRSATAKS